MLKVVFDLVCVGNCMYARNVSEPGLISSLAISVLHPNLQTDV